MHVVDEVRRYFPDHLFADVIPLLALPREVAYRRMAGTLARKGYSPAVVSEVLRDVMQADPDDVDAWD